VPAASRLGQPSTTLGLISVILDQAELNAGLARGSRQRERNGPSAFGVPGLTPQGQEHDPLHTARAPGLNRESKHQSLGRIDAERQA
jgi:hypothetical protein